MKTLRFLFSSFLIALIMTNASAYGFVTKDQPYLTKEFTLDGPGNLNVRTSGGSISVGGSNTNKVIVEMYVKVNGKIVDPQQDGEVRKQLEEYKINISQTSNTIDAIVENTNSGRRSGWNNVNISFNVKTPKAISCRLNTSGGSIHVQGIEGEQNVNTSGGSININEINGTMKAKTSGGSIRIDHFQGKLDASTSGGSINMANARGDLSVNTSGGSINLDDVAGSVTAHTSGGGIKANILVLENHLTLTTSGGSINAVVPKGLGMDLDLKGNNVNTQLTNFSGEVKKDKVLGSMNGGGIKVKMATSGGSVNLRYN